MQKYLTILICLFSTLAFSQTVTVEGYCFGEGNRGYISNVYVRIQHPDTRENLAETYTDKDGYFTVEVPKLKSINVFAKKTQYKMAELDLKLNDDKLFVKIEMRKEPGYLFEVTLADKKESPGSPTSAITGALIEIYNNTERRPELVIDDSEQPEFDVNFKKGNHYTMLIRKPGYLSKRMEAFVDVDGCILCFEGVGRVKPGVADNLTDDNAAGVLLANVELEPIFEGKTLEIENIYYNLGKWNITRKGREQLKKVILVLEDNPNLTIELGSHTDSRGKTAFNKNLSEKRAQASVDFILKNGNVDRDRVISKGYGEEELLNKCADGVQCTEAEHSINRRTELKILNVESMNVYKPLAQMKEEEFLEQEVLKQTEVKVTGDQTLQQYLDEQAEKKEPAQELGKLAVEDTVAIEKRNKAKILAEQMAAQDKKEQLDAEMDRPIVEKTDTVSEKLKEQKLEEMEAKANTDKVTLDIPDSKSMQESKDQMEQFAEEVTNADITAVTSTEKPVKVEEQISKAPAIDKTDQIALGDVDTANVLTTGLSGHKVVIKKNDTMLSPDDDIFKRHDKLELYLADDGRVWYMMGGFRSREEAQTALDSFIKVTYPDAFVATFESGTLK